MLKIKKHEYYSEIKGKDDQGPFSIQIQNDCSQIRWKSGLSDDYINVDVKELTAIRDFINAALRAAGQKP